MLPYFIYPVYGKDTSTGQVITGPADYISDIKSFNTNLNSNLNNKSAKFKTNDFIIIDWNHYRIKYYTNNINVGKWQKITANEFYNKFRFLTPCEAHLYKIQI